MKNLALEQLQANELSLGVGLRQARNTEAAIALETAGFDWLFLDLEHNAMSLETASAICVGVLTRKIAAIARVPEGQFWLATRLLDNGANGVVIPHITTVDEAREVVRQLRYPPVGQRSIGSMQPSVGYADTPVADLTAQLEQNTLVAIMLESAEAVDNCEAIAAVDGIDVLMIGANDLSLNLGVPGQVSDPRVVAAFERVARACSDHGRYAGFGGVRRVEDIARFVAMGYRFLFASDDLRLMVTAGSERTASLRAAAADVVGVPART